MARPHSDLQSVIEYPGRQPEAMLICNRAAVMQRRVLVPGVPIWACLHAWLSYVPGFSMYIVCSVVTLVG